ncbi:MAG: preprotein translocase subunit SecG [Lachnospiraceae bacterium]|nr:preprotein translocase subunit SecG [Lachnospiraceae bacterium]MDY5742017.1 preprotein translocase subunit SecG [Lachnospiraceae bacterium]
MLHLKTILTIIFIIDCVALSVIVLLQEGKENGMSALSGAVQNQDTYYAKIKGRTSEGRLIKLTTLSAVAFLVLSTVLNVLA